MAKTTIEKQFNAGNNRLDKISRDSVIIKDRTLDISTSTFDYDKVNAFKVQDKNNEILGTFDVGINNRNNTRAAMAAYRKISSTTYENKLCLQIGPNGEASVWVNDPAIWRRDLNVVCKAGDTMTGALNFANNTWNKLGDDIYIGDCNHQGMLGIKAASGSGSTGIKLWNLNQNANGIFYFDGTDFNTTVPLKVVGERWSDSDPIGYGLDLQNSNIKGVNAIYMADFASSAGEGINFYKDDTHWDTLWIANGQLLFAPNRTHGTATSDTNSQKVARFTSNPSDQFFVRTDGTTGGVVASNTITRAGEPDLYLKNSTATFGTAPSADAWLGAYCCQDNSGKTLGYYGTVYTSAKIIGSRLLARNGPNSNSLTNHILEIRVDSNGNKSVSLDQSAWRTALGLRAFSYGTLPLFKYKIVTIGSFTMTSGGYYQISSFKPAAPSGYNFMFCNYWTWSSNGGNAIQVQGDGEYVQGTPNQQINNLKVIYYYILSSEITAIP